MKKVIILCGKMRSGKNTAGNILQKYYESLGYKVSQTAFANQVKKECHEVFFPLRSVLLKYVCELQDSFGSKKIPTEVNAKINELMIWDQSWYENKTAITRCLLQTYGTDVFRNKVDENHWVNITKKQIIESEDDIVIVTDGRFVNEIEGMYDPSYILYSIKLERNSEKSNHLSEISLDSFKEFNYIIDNKKNDLESLTAKLIGVANDILENSKIFEKKYEDSINLSPDCSELEKKIHESSLVTLQSKKKCRDFLIKHGLYNIKYEDQ
jgi:hypothetical protein